jgi:hypothetical protein
MKITKLFVLFLSMTMMMFAQAQEELPPYLGVTLEKNIDDLKTEVKSAISKSGFEIIGEYNVANKDGLYVFAFTNNQLKTLCGDFSDRGALASVLKMGLFEKDGKVEVSLLHPNYMFYAYFGDDYKLHAKELDAIDQIAKDILSSNFGEPQGFGGGLSPKDLEKYHYKVMMPYFDDPIELESYSSFEEGLDFIRKKISESGDEIKLVYEIVNDSKQTAVFGIGLLDAEEGEPHFLPIIGERHIAAMPYEIILQQYDATMLHGKYRFALYWPELTMGEFMKIMSTPGDVEKEMESITQKE